MTFMSFTTVNDFGKNYSNKAHHPIHLHGHSFFVVKQGFGEYTVFSYFRIHPHQFHSSITKIIIMMLRTQSLSLKNYCDVHSKTF